MIVLAVALALAGVGWLAAARMGGDEGGGRDRDRGPAPVEVAPVERGPIELRRTFTGTLEARRRFSVAANVGGRVQRVMVDLGDSVKQGQVIAELDDDDEVQGVYESSAELAAARASQADAQAALEIAKREIDRQVGLEARGVLSSAELDRGRAQHLARQTAVQVANARVRSAAAALERAKIRSGYTRVVAAWDGDDAARVVAERHVDEGDTVASGAPLITIVGLAPIDAVVYATEKEYARLRSGQVAAITTDAYPDREFRGALSRLAPVFSERSRQARVEIEIANEERLLRPGMFVRAQVVLDRVEDTTIVPVAALVTRDGKTGVFVVTEGAASDKGGEGADQRGGGKGDKGGDAGLRVRWRSVEPGIEQGERVQLVGEPITGRVVTLGHQLIDDGSPIAIPEVTPRARREAL